MDAYVVGNLAGRLVLSYFVAWCLMLAWDRDWRIAFSRTHRWHGVSCVLILFCVGLVTAT